MMGGHCMYDGCNLYDGSFAKSVTPGLSKAIVLWQKSVKQVGLLLG